VKLALDIVVVSLLAISSLRARSDIHPHPDENLATYKLRMGKKFEAEIARRGFADVASEEAGEYNRSIPPPITTAFMN